jgi:hypothetical protein
MRRIVIPIISNDGGGTHQLNQIKSIIDLNIYYIYPIRNPINSLYIFLREDRFIVSCPFLCAFLHILFFFYPKKNRSILRIVQGNDQKICVDKFGFLMGNIIYNISRRLKVQSLLIIKILDTLKYQYSFSTNCSVFKPFPRLSQHHNDALRQSESGTKIGFLYRGLDVKGFQAFLSAYDKLKKVNLYDFELHLAIFNNIPSPNFDGVTISSMDNRDDFLKWLNTIDIFINTSYHEGVSFLNIEALDSGCRLLVRNLIAYDYLPINIPRFNNDIDIETSLEFMLKNHTREYDWLQWIAKRNLLYIDYQKKLKYEIYRLFS